VPYEAPGTALMPTRGDDGTAVKIKIDRPGR
jgi:hypothetical protein